jgi:predicted RNA-binding protein YlqC (UPF0109 family)
MPPELGADAPQPGAGTPDYAGLLRFLLEPLLDSPDSLRLDCELTKGGQQAWIRLALKGSDRGRALGRGGRNVQAIETLLHAAAAAAGKTIRLEVYGTDRADDRGQNNGANA